MNVSKSASPTNVGEILIHFCLNCRLWLFFSLLNPGCQDSSCPPPLWAPGLSSRSGSPQTLQWAHRVSRPCTKVGECCAWHLITSRAAGGSWCGCREGLHGGSTGLFFKILTKWYATVFCNCQRTQPKKHTWFFLYWSECMNLIVLLTALVTTEGFTYRMACCKVVLT